MIKTGPKPASLEERFFRYVKKTPGCWIWTGNKYRCGYGQIGIGSRTDNSRTKAAAHRISYELHIGKIPKNSYVCHTCNVKECVSPYHLYLASHKQNMIDASRDGLLKKPKNFTKSRIRDSKGRFQ